MYLDTVHTIFYQNRLSFAQDMTTILV